MKKAIEIIEQSKKNSAEIARIDEILKNTPYSKKIVDDKFVALAQKQVNLQIENRILHDNARRALYAEVMPVAIEIINKYAGKPYGEKTKEKISSALKEKTNCAVYIHHSYSDELTLVPLNNEGFSGTWFKYNDFNIYTKYVNGERAAMLIDNKIQPLTLDALVLYDCAAYVENVAERVEEIKATFAAAQKAEKALEDACSAFNKLTPRGIDHITAGHMRNYLFSAWS